MKTLDTLGRIVSTRHRYVENWDDERKIGNALIVTLKFGRRFDSPGEHVQGFDTIKEAITAVRKSIPCGCRECIDVERER